MWDASCDPATQTSDETLSGKMGVFPTSRVLIDSPIGAFSPLPQVLKRHVDRWRLFPASRMAISRIVTPDYLVPRESSVRLVTPAATLNPIARSTDSGCRTIVRREPPISALTPMPGPNATLPLTPT